jgi:hypothetical protein
MIVVQVMMFLKFMLCYVYVMMFMKLLDAIDDFSCTFSIHLFLLFSFDFVII